jgi:hypothetical protein
VPWLIDPKRNIGRARGDQNALDEDGRRTKSWPTNWVHTGHSKIICRSPRSRRINIRQPPLPRNVRIALHKVSNSPSFTSIRNTKRCLRYLGLRANDATRRKTRRCINNSLPKITDVTKRSLVGSVVQTDPDLPTRSAEPHYNSNGQ